MLKSIRSKWKLISVVMLAGLFLSYIGISFLIGHQVGEIVSAAKASSGGDSVEALLMVVNSPKTTLSVKGKAVWALGQLGDSRALATFESLYTGEPCDHSSIVCQHELEKAIKLCQGERNISALVWRHGEFAFR